MTPADLLASVKENLILEHDQDDNLLLRLIASAVGYAEDYQHVPAGFYADVDAPPATKQAVIMLASNWYESRDGSTGGFFADNPAAGRQAWDTVNNLLRIGRRWGV
jgi:uncharacterized phage protein (predicted DNA packaging)